MLQLGIWITIKHPCFSIDPYLDQNLFQWLYVFCPHVLALLKNLYPSIEKLLLNRNISLDGKPVLIFPVEQLFAEQQIGHVQQKELLLQISYSFLAYSKEHGKLYTLRAGQ